MDKSTYQSIDLSDENIGKLFKHATVVFDSSALLEMYNYPDNTRDELLQSVFKNLEGRLWIPAQVQFEYLKNQKKVILKPLVKYDNLLQKQNNNKEGGYISSIEEQLKISKTKIIKSILGSLKAAKEATKKKDNHPHLENEIYSDLETAVSKLEESVTDFEGNLKSFKIKFTEEIEKRKDEVRKNRGSDTISKLVSEQFMHGDEYNFNSLLQISEKGVKRYLNEIPPGYKDGKEKVGLSKYGDLILWMQILDYAKIDNKSIIFVINDGKDDWWSNEYDRKIPRVELLKEFKNYSTGDLLMFDTKTFYYKATKFLDSKIDDKAVKNILAPFSNLKGLKLLGNIVLPEYKPVQIENSYREWLSTSAPIFNIEFDIRYGLGLEVDIAGMNSDNGYVFFEVKQVSTNPEQVLKRAINHIRESSNIILLDTSDPIDYIISLVFESSQSAKTSKKLVDKYSEKFLAHNSNAHIKRYFQVGFISGKGTYSPVYSDYKYFK